MQPGVSIHVGRIRRRPDGRYEIHGDRGEVMLGPRGEGLTREQAERYLDALERRERLRGETVKVRIAE